MAVTITRTARIDDDGTGTTGTVINNAEKTSLYNEIDTALAKVAQLAGGNTFVGVQTIGDAAAGSAGLLTLARDQGAGHLCAWKNLNTGNGASYCAFLNSAGVLAGQIYQTGATTVVFSTSSDQRLKEDHGVARDLQALRDVIVHDFTWTADGIRDRGIFAQETQALYPRAVTIGTDRRTETGALADPWLVDYSKFVPDLIVGWQQHEAVIVELRAALAGLTA